MTALQGSSLLHTQSSSEQSYLPPPLRVGARAGGERARLFVPYKRQPLNPRAGLQPGLCMTGSSSISSSPALPGTHNAS